MISKENVNVKGEKYNTIKPSLLQYAEPANKYLPPVPFPSLRPHLLFSTACQSIS